MIRLIPFVFMGIMLPACTDLLPIDEACYYRAQSNSQLVTQDDYVALMSDTISTMFNEYKENKRLVAPISENSIIYFSDTCNFLENERKLRKYFGDNLSRIEITPIDEDEYGDGFRYYRPD